MTGNGTLALSDGAAYDPATDTWRALTAGPAHPGFVPVWTGSQVIMVAKGSAVRLRRRSDRWIDPCCVGDSGPAAWARPYGPGSALLLIGSSDPSSRRQAHPRLMLLQA